MSDIDFDELDKAVNSLMNQPVADEKPSSEPALDTFEQPEAPQLNQSEFSAPLAAEQLTPNDSSSLDAEQSRPSLAVKRRGQFMDVIHPSADMKSKASSATRASRRGVALEPVSREMTPESSYERSMPQAATTVGAEVSATFESSSTNPTSTGETDEPADTVREDAQLPDPTSDSQLTDDSEPIAPQVSSDNLTLTEAEPISTSGPSLDPLEFADPAESMNSPFLADAKVEKRPLGGVRSDDTEADQLTDEALTETEVIDEPVVLTAEFDDDERIVGLPAELDASLMSLEGRDMSNTPDQSASDEIQSDAAVAPTQLEPADSPEPETSPAEIAPTAEPVTSVQPEPELPRPLAVPDTPQIDEVDMQTADPSNPAPPLPTAPTTEPDEDTESTTSIFNTDEHTVKHTPKHSSGWYTIVVIAVMVVIGVLGGVIFYYLNNGGF